MTTATQNIQPEEQRPAREMPAGDEFLQTGDLVPVRRDAAVRRLKRTLAEMEELFRENRWQAALDLFYPPTEKLPELCDLALDIPVRAKLAFALGQLKCFDDAIAELELCLAREPDNFQHHNSLAYTAYSSLYAAKNREVFLSGKPRRERIALAHRHFAAALALRPDSVTNLYRRGMLLKEIEGKSDAALPFFRQARTVWEKLDAAERQTRRRECKNYVKSLYQLAAVLLKAGHGRQALDVIKKCLAEDESSDYISRVFKYFALGKVHFYLNDFGAARDALRFAMQCGHGPAEDFVCELLARTYLALERVERAGETIAKVPENRRRPYVRWTEADILCKAGDYAAARQVLLKCSRRDRRSRHKSLLRLVKIEYLLKKYDAAQHYARQADTFFREKWGHPLAEALFWRAVCAWRRQDMEKAARLAAELEAFSPGYAGLAKLQARLQGTTASANLRHITEVRHAES